MITIRSLVQKSVEQVKNVAIISIVFFLILLVLPQGLDPFWVQGILCNFLQDLNLILLLSLPHHTKPLGNVWHSS